MPRKKPVEDLREACITEALAIIEASGVESLSLRDVSRRLGVSHQAPYKHFPSRDHILAEIVRRAFDAFAAYLDSQRVPDDPIEDFTAMGRAYLGYALAHPLQYRLMFGTPLPNPVDHPAMMQSAQHAFDVLRECIARLPVDPAKEALTLNLDALFVWSTMHGLASILQTQVLATLHFSPQMLDAAAHHLRQRIARALGLPL